MIDFNFGLCCKKKGGKQYTLCFIDRASTITLKELIT